MDDLDDQMRAIANMVDSEGLMVEYTDSKGRNHSAIRLAGQVRGRAIAGCLCEFLDAQHICMRDRDCPSACHAHVLIVNPISRALYLRDRPKQSDEWGRSSYSYCKLCPVMLNEIIHEYTLDDINGGIV